MLCNRTIISSFPWTLFQIISSGNFSAYDIQSLLNHSMEMIIMMNVTHLPSKRWLISTLADFYVTILGILYVILYTRVYYIHFSSAWIKLLIVKHIISVDINQNCQHCILYYMWRSTRVYVRVSINFHPAHKRWFLFYFFFRDKS